MRNQDEAIMYALYGHTDGKMEGYALGVFFFVVFALLPVLSIVL